MFWAVMVSLWRASQWRLYPVVVVLACASLLWGGRLDATAPYCAPPDVNELKDGVDQIYQAVSAEDPDHPAQRLAADLYLYRLTGELTEAAAELKARIGDQAFFALELLLGHYERWGLEISKKKTLDGILEFRPSSDAALVKLLDLKKPESLESLREALLSDVVADPAKLSRLMEVSSIVHEFEYALASVFTDEQRSEFYANWTRPGAAKDGKLEVDEGFATLESMREFTAWMKRRHLMIRSEDLQGLSEEDQNAIYEQRAEILAQLQTDWWEVVRARSDRDALRGLPTKSLPELVKGLKAIDDLDTEEFSSEQSLGDFLDRVTISQDPSDPNPPDFIPEVKTNVTYGGSILFQAFVMNGNRGESDRKAEPFAYKDYLRSLNLSKHHKDSWRDVVVTINRPAPPPRELLPPQAPEAPRDQSDYDDSRVFLTKQERDDQEASYQRELKAYHQALKVWEQTRKPDYDKWLTDNVYRGRFSAVAATSAEWVRLEAKALEDLEKNYLMALVANAGLEEPTPYSFNENDYALASMSLERLAALHLIRSFIPSFSIETPEAEVQRVLGEVRDFDVSLKRVFSNESPRFAFSDIESFRKNKKDIERDLDALSRLMPGIDPLFHGFCGGKPMARGFQTSEARAQSMVEFQKTRVVEPLKAGEACRFESDRDFSKRLKDFRKDRESHRAEMAARTRQSLESFYEDLSKVDFSKLLEDAYVEFGVLTRQAEETGETASAAERKELDDKIAQLKDLISELQKKISEVTEQGRDQQQLDDAYLSRILERFTFKEMTIPQLEALDFLLKRYDWLDAYQAGEVAAGGSEATLELLQFSEFLARFRVTSPGQAGDLLLSAQRLSTDEGFLIYLAGEDWKSKLPLNRKRDRVAAYVVLQKSHFLREAVERLTQFQLWSRRVGQVDQDGKFSAPMTIEKQKRVREIMEFFKANGFEFAEDRWDDLLAQASELYWQTSQKEKEASYYLGVEHLKFQKDPSNPLVKRTSIDIGADEAVKAGESRLVEGALGPQAARGFNINVRDYASMYRDELKLPTQVSRSGLRRWAGYAATRFVSEAESSDPDLVVRQGREMSESEQAEFAQKAINLRAALSRSISGTALPWDAVLSHLFRADEVGKTYSDLFLGQDPEEWPEFISVGKSGESVGLERGVFEAFRFVGLKPTEKMIRLLKRHEYSAWLETFNDESLKFFKAAYEVQGWAQSQPQPGGLTKDEILHVIDTYRHSPEFRKLFQANFSETLDKGVLRRVLDDLGWSAKHFGKSKLDKTLSTQLTTLRTFLVVGSNLFDSGSQNPEGRAWISEAAFYMSSDLMDRILVSSAIEQSGIPLASKAPFVEERLRAIRDILFQVGMEGRTQTYQDVADFVEIAEQKAPGFSLDQFVEELGKIVLSTRGDMFEKAEPLIALVPTELRTHPALRSILELLAGDYPSWQIGGHLSAAKTEDYRKLFERPIIHDQRLASLKEAIRFVVEDADEMIAESFEDWKRAIHSQVKAGQPLPTDAEIKESLKSQVQQAQGQASQAIAKVVGSEIGSMHDFWFVGLRGLQSPFELRDRASQFGGAKSAEQALDSILWKNPQSRVLKGDPRRSRGEILLEEIYGFDGLLALKAEPKKFYEQRLAQAQEAAELGVEVQSFVTNAEALRVVQKASAQIFEFMQWYISEMKGAAAAQQSQSDPQAQIAGLAKREESLKKDSRWIELGSLEVDPSTLSDEQVLTFLKSLKLDVSDPIQGRVILRDLKKFLELKTRTAQLLEDNQAFSKSFGPDERLKASQNEVFQQLVSVVGLGLNYGIEPAQFSKALRDSNSQRMQGWVEQANERFEHIRKTSSVWGFVSGTGRGMGKAIANLAVGSAHAFAGQILYKSFEYGLLQGIYLNTLLGTMDDKDFTNIVAALGGWNEDGSQRDLGHFDLFKMNIGQQMENGTMGRFLADQMRQYSFVRQENLMTTQGMATHLGGTAFSWATVGLSSIARSTDGVLNPALRQGFAERGVRGAGQWVSQSRAMNSMRRLATKAKETRLGSVGMRVGQSVNSSFILWNPRNWRPHYLTDAARSMGISAPSLPNLPLPFLARRNPTEVSKTLVQALKKERWALQKPMPQGFMAKQAALQEATAVSTAQATKAVAEATRRIGYFERKSLAGYSHGYAKTARWVDEKLTSWGPALRAQGWFLTAQSVLLTVPTVAPHFLWAPEMLSTDENYRTMAIVDQIFESVAVIVSLSLTGRVSNWAANRVPKGNNLALYHAGRLGITASAGLNWSIMHNIGLGVTQASVPFGFVAADSDRWGAFLGVTQERRNQIILGNPEAAGDMQIISNFFSQAALGYIILKNNNWDQLATGEISARNQNPTKGDEFRAKLGRVWREASLGMPHEGIKQMRGLQNMDPIYMKKAIEDQIIATAMRAPDIETMNRTVADMKAKVLDPENRQGLIRKIEMTLQTKLHQSERESLIKEMDEIFESALNRAQELQLRMTALKGKDFLPQFRSFLNRLPAQEGSGAVDTDVDINFATLKEQMDSVGLPIEFLLTHQGEEIVATLQERLKRLERGGTVDQSLLGVPDAVRRFGQNSRYLEALLTDITFDPRRLDRAQRLLTGTDGYVGPVMRFRAQEALNNGLIFEILDAGGDVSGREIRYFGQQALLGIDQRPTGEMLDTVVVELDQLSKHRFEFQTGPSAGIHYRISSEGIEFLAAKGRRFFVKKSEGGDLDIRMRAQGQTDTVEYQSVAEGMRALQEAGVFVSLRSEGRDRIVERPFKGKQPLEVIPIQGSIDLAPGVKVAYEQRMLKWSDLIYQVPHPDGSSHLVLKWPHDDGRKDRYLPVLPGRHPIFDGEKHTILLPMTNGLVIKIDVQKGEVTRHLSHDLETAIGTPLGGEAFFELSKEAAQSQNLMMAEVEMIGTAIRQGLKFDPPQSISETHQKAETFFNAIDALNLEGVGLVNLTREALDKAYQRLMQHFDPRNNSSPFVLQKRQEVRDAYQALSFFLDVSSVDYYDLLGVKTDSTEETIRSAYVSKLDALLDQGRVEGISEEAQGVIEREMQRLVEGYETLTDSERRSAYDFYRQMRRPAAKDTPDQAATPDSIRRKFEAGRDYYADLEIEGAFDRGQKMSSEEIRSHYVRLMRDLDPNTLSARLDRGEITADQYAQMLKQASIVNTAYDVLQDPSVRSQYHLDHATAQR